MDQQTAYSTKRLDHLGIVAGICHEIELVERVDTVVGKDGRKVSVGQAVQEMVLNGLGFVSRPLYLAPEFMAGKPVDMLIGEGLTAEDFNDDSLGRVLDRLYEVGVTEVFAYVAAHAIAIMGTNTDAAYTKPLPMDCFPLTTGPHHIPNAVKYRPIVGAGSPSPAFFRWFGQHFLDFAPQRTWYAKVIDIFRFWGSIVTQVASRFSLVVRTSILYEMRSFFTPQSFLRIDTYRL